MRNRSTARPMLMSAETEYSVVGEIHGSLRPPELLFESLRAAVCSERRWLSDRHSRNLTGVFLENGARLYLEINGHPEYAQPEANTPLEVAVHDKAGEQILERAAAVTMRHHPHMCLKVVKNNLDTYFPDNVTFGSHESYTCWDFESAPAALLPHLASRIIYAGAGCLSGRKGAMGFELSQRARHMVRSVGEETTSQRALFCNRVRKRIDHSPWGYVRAHLICRDSLRLPFGTYLTFGTTGLLFHHLNHGRMPAAQLTLKSPVRSLQTISMDPWLKTKVPLLDGRRMTAIELQQALLDECSALQNHNDVPDWSEPLLNDWAETLDQLRNDPLGLSHRLDLYLKLAVYNDQIVRAGFRWGQVHEMLKDLAAARQRFPARVMARLFEDNDLPHPPELAQDLNAARQVFRDREPLARLTNSLQLLEYRYHSLNDWCDVLTRANEVSTAPLTAEQIDTAMTQPPPGNRAASRGELVRQHSGSADWLCDWNAVYRQDEGRVFDLSDPFSNRLPA